MVVLHFCIILCTLSQKHKNINSYTDWLCSFVKQETPEQREGAFSNFRISQVTIDKLKGKRNRHIELCIFWRSDWTDGNHCNTKPVTGRFMNSSFSPFTENTCWIVISDPRRCAQSLIINCSSLSLSSRSLLPVRHSSQVIQSCVWRRRCYCPSPNWNRKDFLLCHSIGGEAPEGCSGTDQRPSSHGTHTHTRTPITKN